VSGTAIVTADWGKKQNQYTAPVASCTERARPPARFGPSLAKTKQDKDWNSSVKMRRFGMLAPSLLFGWSNRWIHCGRSLLLFRTEHMLNSVSRIVTVWH
jgi:hypothetical protein